MSETDWPSIWNQLGEAGRAFGRWMRGHEEELRVFVIWGSVLRGCERTRLYAPVDADSWQAIKDVADDESKSDAELEAVILARYGPDGPGFEALRSEISEAPLLQDRLKDVGEVLEAFESGRNYLTICGTLPLVEFVLSNAKGKWDQPNELPISRRLFEESGLSEHDEAHLLLYGAAVEIASESGSTKSGSPPHTRLEGSRGSEPPPGPARDCAGLVDPGERHPGGTPVSRGLPGCRAAPRSSPGEARRRFWVDKLWMDR